MKIIDLQYFGNINWFLRIANMKHIYFFQNESYKKMTFRNRTIVAGSNGTINLSVPVEGGRNQKQKYNEVKIAYNENWQAHQWQTILSCYGKSPYFEFYAPGLQQFFMAKPEYLFAHNLSILSYLKNSLKLSFNFEAIETTSVTEHSVEDFRDTDLPKHFSSGFGIKPYPQVFQERIGFIPNLSILDLLFNCGPQAKEILRKT